MAHRSTVMAGRSHGQSGSPVTFGWKAASSADEVRAVWTGSGRAPRWLVGQLGGGAGSLVFYGSLGLAVRARFCAELGLADPGISWPASATAAPYSPSCSRWSADAGPDRRRGLGAAAAGDGELAEAPAGAVGSIAIRTANRSQ